MRHIREAAPSAAFFKLINYQPYPYQEAIHNSWSLYRVAIIGRQSGKSEVASVEAAFEILMRAGRTGWVVAPTYEQATIIFERVVEYVRRADEVLPGTRKLQVSYRNLRMSIQHYDAQGKFLGISRFQGKSGDSPDNLRGASLDFIIMDEAAMVDEKVWYEALMPTLTTTNGWVLIITTPKGFNWVHAMFREALEMAGHPKYPNYTKYAAWQLPTWEANPSVPKEFFEEQKRVQPDRTYRQEYGAEFIPDSGSVFQGLVEVPKAPVQYDGHSIYTEPVRSMTRYVIGADFGRLDDFSVFTAVDMDRRKVVEVLRVNTVSWERQLERLKNMQQKYRAFVVADVQGSGDVLAGQMASMQIPFEGVAFKTTNIKEEYINKLALAIEHKRIILPDDKEYLDEFRDFVYERTPGGRLQMKAAGRGKDDRVVSLALAWWQVAEHGSGAVEMGSQDAGWLVHMQDNALDAVDDLERLFT